MELWNSLPDNLSHLDLSLTVPLSADDASILTESVAPSDLYYSALTEFTYLLTLQKKQLKQYIISCKTVADRPTLKITVLNTKTSIIGSRFRARHGCVFDLPLFFTLRGPCD